MPHNIVLLIISIVSVIFTCLAIANIVKRRVRNKEYYKIENKIIFTNVCRKFIPNLIVLTIIITWILIVTPLGNKINEVIILTSGALVFIISVILTIIVNCKWKKLIKDYGYEYVHNIVLRGMNYRENRHNRRD